MQLWGLASSKSVGQVSRLETQVGFDARVEAEFLLPETTVFAPMDFQLNGNLLNVK